MLQLFIDTNVYLTFFSFTEEDLEELRKLRAAINTGDIRLWVTPQVVQELRRNREAKVAESMASLRKLKPPGALPQMVRNLPEFEGFVEARREFERQVNALDAQLTKEFFEGSLAADAVLAELLEASRPIVVTDEILEAARKRVDLGNPPGKKGSLGDAINWECLLSACPQDLDIHIVTADSDFISRMNRERVSSYLAAEWREAKRSEITLHPRISSFFQEHFPAIALATELEKELRIRALTESDSFENTHRAINALSAYSDFSDQQATELLEAALTNSQISWIARDTDVRSFFGGIIGGHPNAVVPDKMAALRRSFRMPAPGSIELPDDFEM